MADMPENLPPVCEPALSAEEPMSVERCILMSRLREIRRFVVDMKLEKVLKREEVKTERTLRTLARVLEEVMCAMLTMLERDK